MLLSPPKMRVFKPFARVVNVPDFRPRTVDELYLQHARRTQERLDWLRCGPEIGWAQCLFSEDADYTAVASTAVEASLMTPVSGNSKAQPLISAAFFANDCTTRWLQMECAGTFGNTGTPTLTFGFRMGTSTTWSASDTAVGVSAAITTASGVSNKYWRAVLNISCRIPGFGTNGMTLSCHGYVHSMSGFGTPFEYPIEPTTPDTSTWTVATLDGSLSYYLRPSITWSASSSSNTIVMKHCKLLRMW